MYPAGHFFAAQQLQQAQLEAANVPNNPCTSQELPKGRERGKHVQKQKQKQNPKAADWSVEETKELLYAWSARFEKLKGASTKVRTAIWNEIFEEFKSSCSETERTFPQVKKRLQNLEYEFKQLKLKASKTGEEGMKKIKENFPYYSIFDQTMGYRDSVDPAKMEIESSSFIPSASDAGPTAQPISSGEKEREESVTSAASLENEAIPSTSAGVKRGCSEVRGKESRKKKRGKKDEANATDDWGAFKEMWEKSLHQENERFEKSMKMFQENQKFQMEQTASLLSGFTDVMKNLMKE